MESKWPLSINRVYLSILYGLFGLILLEGKSIIDKETWVTRPEKQHSAAKTAIDTRIYTLLQHKCKKINGRSALYLFILHYELTERHQIKYN